MNDNGRKPSGKQSGNEYPWWYSGSYCLTALFWCFTLAVAWRGTFSAEGMTITVVTTFVVSLALAVLQSSMASVRGK
jgi:uncharacterized membrane protein YhaH (DUF805 family)